MEGCLCCPLRKNSHEDWIVGKLKTGFTMHKDEIKSDVYNVMKQRGSKNAFIDKHPGKKWVTIFLK